MSTKQLRPKYPSGIDAQELSKFEKGIETDGVLNTGLIEHSVGAEMAVPQGDLTDNAFPSSIRYNPSTDEFEGGYGDDSWKILGGGGIRWEKADTSQTVHNTKTSRGYLIDNRLAPTTVVLPIITQIGLSVSIADLFGAFAIYPLTINAKGKRIYGQTDDMTLSTNHVAATFTWTGDELGWIVTNGVGLGQGQVYTRSIYSNVTKQPTVFIDMTHDVEMVDVYVGGARLSEKKYQLLEAGVAFKEEIPANVEIQVIEYKPLQLTIQDENSRLDAIENTVNDLKNGPLIWWYTAVGGETNLNPGTAFTKAKVEINGIGVDIEDFDIIDNKIVLHEPLAVDEITGLGDRVKVTIGFDNPVGSEFITKAELSSVNGTSLVNGIYGSLDKYLNYVTPSMFYQDGDGDDYGPAIMRMFSIMKENNIKGVIDKDYDYRSNISINLSENDNFSLDGRTGVLNQFSNSSIVFQNTLVGNVYSVTAVEELFYNLGDGTTNSLVNSINCPGHQFTSRGQIGRIFSDDIVPDFDADGQYLAEYFVVGDIVGDTIYTTGKLTENYTTGIKLCRPSNAKIKIEGLNINGVLQDSSIAGAVTVRGFISPELDKLVCHNMNSTFLSLTSCFMANVGSVFGEVIKNRPDLNAYGYLVNDSGSDMSCIQLINSVYARHGFTTTTPKTTIGDNRWDLKGRSKHGLIKTVVANGNANAVDSHSPAFMMTYDTIKVNCDFRGNTTGGAGVQIRGNSCVVNNLEIYGSKIGLAISGANKTSDSTILIKNMRYVGGKANTPVVINGSGSFKTLVFIENLYVDTENSSAIQINNGSVVINNLMGKFYPYLPNSPLVILGLNSSFKVKAGEIFVGGANSGIQLVSHSEDNTVSEINLSVQGVSGKLSYLASSSSQYNSVKSYYDVKLDANLPGSPFLGFNPNPMIGAKITTDFNKKPLGYRDLTYGTAGNVSLNLQYSFEDSIFVRATVNIDGVVINAVTQGAFQGQRLIINNRNSSTSTLLIQNGNSGLLALGTSITIPIGQGAQLVWDGSFWRNSVLL